jgi:hypothetical protein
VTVLTAQAVTISYHTSRIRVDARFSFEKKDKLIRRPQYTAKQPRNTTGTWLSALECARQDRPSPCQPLRLSASVSPVHTAPGCTCTKYFVSYSITEVRSCVGLSSCHRASFFMSVSPYAVWLLRRLAFTAPVGHVRETFRGRV